jgi:putative alpha-1,2-mannosidase
MQGANEGTTIMYIYGELSNANYTIHNTNEPNKQNLTFDLSQSKTIEFKFATSFISQEQAKRNLQMEINNNLNFDSLVTYAGNT